jgi:hypothetical protein
VRRRGVEEEEEVEDVGVPAAPAPPRRQLRRRGYGSAVAAPLPASSPPLLPFLLRLRAGG